MAVSINYITHIADDVDRTTYTFNNVPIGAAATDRLVVISTSTYRSGASVISSATINGSPATIFVQTAGSNVWTGLFGLRVPTGATTTVTVTYGAEARTGSIGVFTVTGQESDTPFATAGPAGGSDSNRSATITVPADGGVIGSSGGANSNCTWSNITEQFDIFTDGNLNHSGAAKTSAVLLTNNIISCANVRAICAASWAPRVAFVAPKAMHYRRLRI